MSPEENKQLVCRYFEAIDAACEAGNTDIIEDFLALDFVEHNRFPASPPTRDGWKQAFMAFVAGAPGYHVIEERRRDRRPWRQRVAPQPREAVRERSESTTARIA
jgi:hypothetical protein